jgi:transglutaminase-like putative cysteine protease
VPISAGLAVLLSSTALCGVLDGFQWLWCVLLAVTVVVAIGLAARTVRLPVLVAVPAQLVGLALTLTGLFGRHPLFGVLPRAATVRDLASQLSGSIDQIESGIPPVATTPALSLLVTLGFGLVMVMVDPLVMAGHGPAVGGLVLLGGYTVPTALDPDALPVWTLVAGAAGYALHLLFVHREQLARRGILAEPPQAPTGTSAWQRHWRRRCAVGRAGTGAPIAVALTAVALALALVISSFATMIGTDGRFSGNGRGHSKYSAAEFGLNPFTTLRGELEKSKSTELMRVRGLPGPEYMRALTLTRYVPQQGWQLTDRRTGVDMNGALPSGLGVPVNNPTATIQIQNLGYQDRWLPLYGQPMAVSGLIPGRWRYDVITGTAYASGALTEPAWTERAGLPDPSLATLEQSEPAQDVDPTYFDTGGVTTRIGDLARAITRAAASPFEKAVTLNRYLLDPANGYHYSLKTEPGSTGDALENFLFRGKTGYCEQFASAMAVMLRTVGVPARVAVGFTSGQQEDGYQSISTSDAHAWVEGYFAGVGWLPFDPTPLDDGRSITPSYVAQAPTVPINVPPSVLAARQGPGEGEGGQPPPPAQGQQPSPAQGEGQGQDPGQQQPGAGQSPGPGGNQQGSSGESPGSSGGDNDAGGGQPYSQPHAAAHGPGLVRSGVGLAVLLTLLGILVIAALVGTPAALRTLARRRRLVRAARGGAAGAEAAWREVLAEFADRGADAAGNDTVRGSACRLGRTHRLDGEAVHGLRTVVGAVERGWYAPPTDPDPRPDLVAAVNTVRGGLRTSSPLRLGARLWPRSVLPRRNGSGNPSSAQREAGRRPAK